MDVRIAAGVTVPLVAAGALGVAAALAVRATSPTPIAAIDRAPEFVGNCDRSDLEALERWQGDGRPHVHFCTPNRRGPHAAYVTLWSFVESRAEVHLFGAGLQDLATPILVPLGDICKPEPAVVDIDGVEELLLGSPTLDVQAMWAGTTPDQSTVCARLIAARAGKLAARDLFDHESRTAEK